MAPGTIRRADQVNRSKLISRMQGAREAGGLQDRVPMQLEPGQRLQTGDICPWYAPLMAQIDETAFTTEKY